MSWVVGVSGLICVRQASRGGVLVLNTMHSDEACRLKDTCKHPMLKCMPYIVGR